MLIVAYRAAPQLAPYTESPNLTKPKAEKKGKKAKEAETAAMIDVTYFASAAAPALVAPSAATAASTGTTTPAPRAKFAPVGSFVAHPASGEASPVPSGGRIALNLKRKADDDGTGTPPSKRR